MLSLQVYRHIDDALRTRPLWFPVEAPYPLTDGHIPQHTQCQVTATHLETSQGWPAQIGIQWLVKRNKLLPWVHVVNWREETLFDYSKPILERKLGFTPMGNDVEMANIITQQVFDPAENAETIEWEDRLLQKLHDDWFEHLCAQSDIA